MTTVVAETQREMLSLVTARISDAYLRKPYYVDGGADLVSVCLLYTSEAADALGVSLGQIAKSVIFRRRADEAAVLVVTSGDRRVDEKRVAAITGPLGRADADFVKARTGFSIGGVSPLAHAWPCVTLIDRDLYRFDLIWAAAGHPNGVFRLAPQDLARLTGAPVADVVQP